METESLTAAERAALLSLLDDRTGSVRKALLSRFAQLGAAASQFLQEVAHGPNRILGRHAQWFLEQLKFDDPIAEFRTFIRSLNYELETGALLLNRTVAPDLDVARCCAALDSIAGRCRELIAAPASTREQCRIINRVLFHEWGFHGNVEHYTDPENSLIDRVLVRRKGIPVSLTIVYLLVAGRLGLELEPVALPSHFIVGCYTETEPFFIDPFDRGLFLDVEDVFAMIRKLHVVPQASDLMPTPVREVLYRCCRNLVGHYDVSGDPERSRLFASFVEEFESTYARHTT